MGCVAGQIYQFTLEAAEEIFRHRIVVGLALPGHTLHKAQFFELFPVRRCRILHAPIRMKHQPWRRMLPFYSHAECRQGQRRIDAVGKCIAHHFLVQRSFMIARATTRKDCAVDAPTDFSSDCTEMTQEYCRISRNFCVI